jgi:hypothetical protein
MYAQIKIHKLQNINIFLCFYIDEKEAFRILEASFLLTYFIKAACLQMSQNISRKYNLRKMYKNYKKSKKIQVMICMSCVIYD